MLDLQRLQEALADRYLVSRELGRGGMASVYLAEDLRHGRRVALKVVRPEVVSQIGRERFLREIRVTAGLSHPHIEPLLDSGEVDGTLFYVMPLVEGATLADRLRAEGTLPVKEALRLTTEVADALDYAHGRQVVHRDVKPSNILLEAGHAVLSDFGVALPTTTPPGTRMTRSGVTVGTAEYMSPEQCSGDRPVDARSDVYSLGCVLHEALAGRPPFTARTPAAVVAMQLRDAPQPLRELREDLPAEVEAVVLKALKKDPAERFCSAREFAYALQGSITAPSLPFPMAVTPGAMRVAGAVLGVAVSAALVAGWWGSRAEGVVLDERRYAVASFFQQDSARVRVVDGSRCQTRLREALARWEDVELVDPALIRDRELRHDGEPPTRDLVLEDAASVGAGRLVWGQVWNESDTIRVEARLYDVASGASLRSHRLAIGPDADVASLFDEMADSLLVGAVASEAAARASAGGTRSLTALGFYDSGHRYLRSWDLPGARTAFNAALDEDPGYVQASLWRSLVGLFEGAAHDDWVSYAASAVRSSEVLPARDRLLARGLFELAESRWQEACTSFRQVLARDSLHFAAWLGLGDCLSRDDAVVATSGDTEGWRFRTSYQEAGEAFLRALELAPSFNSAMGEDGGSQFRRVFPIRVGDYRPGRGGADGARRFGALPELLGDTIAYRPVPIEEIGAAGPPPTTAGAVRLNQVIRGRVTEDWLTAFPFDPAALVAHALTLEVRGMVASGGSTLTSALDAIARARETEPDRVGEERVVRAATQVRLLLKDAQIQAAVALADSVLGWPRVSTVPALEASAGLAVLRGRPSLAADLLQAAAPDYRFSLLASQRAAAVPLRESVLRFSAFAAAGGPLDSLRVIRRRFKDEAQRLLPAGESENVLSAIVSDALAIAYTVLPAEDDDPSAGSWNPLLPLLRGASRGDTVGLRSGREELAGLLSNVTRGGVPFSIGWAAVNLSLSVGDTLAAADQVIGLLSSLRAQSQLLIQPSEAGALVRSMMLSARLAPERGSWGGVAAQLWGDGDPYARSRIQLQTRTLPPPGR